MKKNPCVAMPQLRPIQAKPESEKKGKSWHTTPSSHHVLSPATAHPNTSRNQHGIKRFLR